MNGAPNSQQWRHYSAHGGWDPEAVVVTQRIDCSQLTTGGSCSVTEGSQTQLFGPPGDDFTLDTSYGNAGMLPLPGPGLEALQNSIERDEEPAEEAGLENSQDNTEEGEEEGDDDDGIPRESAGRRRKRTKRQRFVYSLKPILGSYKLFLNPLYVPQFLRNCDAEVQLEGKILHCPNKTREWGNNFELVWTTMNTNVSEEWIQKYYANNPDNKQMLKEAILAYEKKHPPKKRAAVRNQEENVTPATPQVRNTGQNGTPPSEVRAARAAAFGTSSSYSTVSSLTGSNRSGSNRSGAVTRNSAVDTVESDSDEGLELDEEDNAYVPLPAGTLPEDIESDEEEEAAEDMQQPTTESGARLAELQWKFTPVSTNGSLFDTPVMSTEETRLKEGIAEQFADPFGAIKVLGGFSYPFVARLTRNSNDYAVRHILPKYPSHYRFHGEKWRTIEVYEMYRFLGIMLKISLSPVDSGGYQSYFGKSDTSIRYNSSSPPLSIANSRGFAQDYMTLARFRQIRMAYHPEEKSKGDGGDKCYQIRNAIKTCNAAAIFCFLIGKNMTFDEGGIACRSRFCPVRMYNSQKPDKFRVDLFILACAASYVIFNVDVYQGRNKANVEIDASIVDLPTTQKAPMNACIQAGLLTDPDPRARHLTLDN